MPKPEWGGWDFQLANRPCARAAEPLSAGAGVGRFFMIVMGGRQGKEGEKLAGTLGKTGKEKSKEETVNDNRGLVRGWAKEQRVRGERKVAASTQNRALIVLLSPKDKYFS